MSVRPVTVRLNLTLQVPRDTSRSSVILNDVIRHTKMLRQYWWPSKYDGVIKWKHSLRYWPYVRGIHRSPVVPLTVTRNFDVSFDWRLNKRLSKQSRRRWVETPLRSLGRHCNVCTEESMPNFQFGNVPDGLAPTVGRQRDHAFNWNIYSELIWNGIYNCNTSDDELLKSVVLFAWWI